MAARPVIGFDMRMTRRLETVILATAVMAVAATLALTSVAAGITAFLR